MGQGCDFKQTSSTAKEWAGAVASNRPVLGLWIGIGPVVTELYSNFKWTGRGRAVAYICMCNLLLLFFVFVVVVV